MTDFHDWYDDNLQRLIKGNLHDALSESWQAAQKAEREKPMNDFDEWLNTHHPDLDAPSTGFAREVWQAATNAERQRILSIIDAVGVQGNSDQWFDAVDKIREAING